MNPFRQSFSFNNLTVTWNNGRLQYRCKTCNKFMSYSNILDLLCRHCKTLTTKER